MNHTPTDGPFYGYEGISKLLNKLYSTAQVISLLTGDYIIQTSTKTSTTNLKNGDLFLRSTQYTCMYAFPHTHTNLAQCHCVSFVVITLIAIFLIIHNMNKAIIHKGVKNQNHVFALCNTSGTVALNVPKLGAFKLKRKGQGQYAVC